MEEDQSHNLYNTGVVASEGQPNSSNEYPAKASSTEANGDLEPPYTPLDVWVK